MSFWPGNKKVGWSEIEQRRGYLPSAPPAAGYIWGFPRVVATAGLGQGEMVLATGAQGIHRTYALDCRPSFG